MNNRTHLIITGSLLLANSGLAVANVFTTSDVFSSPAAATATEFAPGQPPPALHEQAEPVPAAGYPPPVPVAGEAPPSGATSSPSSSAPKASADQTKRIGKSVPGVPDLDHNPPKSEWHRKAAKTANNKGYRHYRKKRYRKAMVYWKRALKLRPAHTLARYNLACGYALIGKPENALRLLEQIKANADDERCWLCKKQLNHARGDNDLSSLRGNPRLVKILE